MRRILRILSLVLPIALMAAPRVHAESIRLTSGKTFQGQIIGHDARELRLMRENGPMDVPFNMITAIENDDQPAYPQLEDLKERWKSSRADAVSRSGRYIKGGRDKASAARTSVAVELYMTMWCPYCRKMESFLKKNGIKYRRYNIEADRAANRRYQSMGGGGIPLTKVGEYVIRGYDPGAVLRALR